jgi:hypothetical protein
MAVFEENGCPAREECPIALEGGACLHKIGSPREKISAQKKEKSRPQKEKQEAGLTGSEKDGKDASYHF